MDSRETAIRAMLPSVRRIALRLKRLVPALDLDDLIGDGSVGLIRAVDSFDPQRGPSLEHYACRLILGAMLNGVRRMDPVSERSRRLARAVENERYAIAAQRGDVPTSAEMEARRPGFARAAHAAHWGQPLSLDAALPDGESLPRDFRGDPASIYEQQRVGEALGALVDALPVKHRTVVMQHYFGGRSLRAIGRRLAISPQRTSQIHRAAIARLAKTFDVA